MKPNDGGSAFPRSGAMLNDGEHAFMVRPQGGMTLWDYFVAHAPVPEQWPSKQKAEEAAQYADAMIAEREKRFGK